MPGNHNHDCVESKTIFFPKINLYWVWIISYKKQIHCKNEPQSTLKVKFQIIENIVHMITLKTEVGLYGV